MAPPALIFGPEFPPVSDPVRMFTQKLPTLGQYCSFHTMEQHTLKNVNSCWNTQITFYLETYGGQNNNPLLNVIHFFNTRVIRHLRQLENVAFLHSIRKDCFQVKSNLLTDSRFTTHMNIMILN